MNKVQNQQADYLSLKIESQFNIDYNFYPYTNIMIDFSQLYIDCEKIVKRRQEKNGGSEYYLNIPLSFDIETSSFYENDEKRACMYIWQMGINGKAYYGRTWEEFKKIINYINNTLEDNERCIIWVHNLAYEFQWIKKLFRWNNLFATENRKVVYAEYDKIIFRCSYFLSNSSLAKIGNDLIKYKVEKLKGDLDYKKIRHYKTPLSQEEMNYCRNDVLVLNAYIQEKIETEGNILKIPLTKTGYIRRRMLENCYKSEGFISTINKLTVTPIEYVYLKQAFQGGFTHANAGYVDETLENISSVDITSSYPYVMLAKKFPMSKGKEYMPKSGEEFRQILNDYCCLIDVTFYGVQSKLLQDMPISESKCLFIKDKVVDNGRVYEASELRMIMTDVDLRVYEQFYNIDKKYLNKLIIYKKGYLPKPIIETVLDLYEGKTTLKGVEGKEFEYQQEKGDLNSTYGMMVQDIVRDIIDFDYNELEWRDPERVNKKDYTNDILKDDIFKYNKNKNFKRTTFYPWGVWITAYARERLFNAMIECGDDYKYSDTDSVKIANFENHKKYFEHVNNVKVPHELEGMCNFYNIDYERVRPKTIKGEEKLIGVWDFEGTYSRFKTLGAKRYMYEENGELHVTVAGVNKKDTAKYLSQFKNPFDRFKTGLRVPKEFSGRSIVTYIDDEIKGEVIDYLGEKCYYKESGSIHIEESDYNLNRSDDFTNFIKLFQGIKEVSQL